MSKSPHLIPTTLLFSIFFEPCDSFHNAYFMLLFIAASAFITYPDMTVASDLFFVLAYINSIAIAITRLMWHIHFFLSASFIKSSTVFSLICQLLWFSLYCETVSLLSIGLKEPCQVTVGSLTTENNSNKFDISLLHILFYLMWYLLYYTVINILLNISNIWWHFIVFIRGFLPLVSRLRTGEISGNYHTTI